MVLGSTPPPIGIEKGIRHCVSFVWGFFFQIVFFFPKPCFVNNIIKNDGMYEMIVNSATNLRVILIIPATENNYRFF